MAQEPSTTSYKFSNWVMLVVAGWLFLSPWIFVIPPELMFVSWNFWTVGALMGLLAIIALFNIARWEDSLNLALSIWLFLSPWIVGYSDQTVLMWNACIVALLAACVSIWGIIAARDAEEAMDRTRHVHQ